LCLPSGFFPSGFPTETMYTPLFCLIRATCPAYLILDLITRIVFGEQYRSLSSSLCRFLHTPVTWSLFGSNILLSTLFSITLSLRSSLNVDDQVPLPYKTTGKIIVHIHKHYVNEISFGSQQILTWWRSESFECMTNLTNTLSV
jgi:hypothetical protein